MEIIEVLTNLINNVGFPIAAFVMIWWQNKEMTKSLDKNTEVLVELKTVVEGIHNEND